MYTYLPWELESEILCRVPATSLKQLRFTCKRWYALSKDPSFIKKNLCKAAPQMVLKKYQSVFSVSIDFHGHNRDDQFLKFTGQLENPKDPEGGVKISEIFQCEGLLLCTTKDKRLVVWNPCTGQTRCIQSSTMHHSCFLGYKNKNKYSLDSYKILSSSKSSSGWNATVVKFEMYEFETGSWKVIDADTHNLGVLSLGVSLKGDTYWLDSDDYEKHPNLVNSMVRFDFTSERFGRLPLPFLSDNNYYEYQIAVLSVVRDEKLAVLHQRLRSLEMKIWVTNTITDEAKDDLSWSVFLVVDLGELWINNMTKLTSFLVDEENKRVMCCFLDRDMTAVYIVGKDIYKQVYREIYREVKKHRRFSLERSKRPLLVSYVPSLVRIPARQSNPGGKRKKVIKLIQLPS